MHVQFIFWLPLGLSVVGAIYFFAFTEESLKWKLLMAALAAAALVLQFAFRVHFAIPLALQLVVCVWTLIYWKLHT